MPVPRGALVADTLADFAAVDDSLVFPRGAAPEIKNVTQVGPRTFRCLLRHRGNPWSPLNPGGVKGAWYDGDRTLEWNEGKRDGAYHDKSRAEMSGLHGVGQARDLLVPGTTWDIATTVRLDPSFVPGNGYCNLMQPVFDQSFLTLTGISGDLVTAQLMVFESGIGSRTKVARQFTIRRGEWTSVVVRVKFGPRGMYQCSVNGDAFRGIRIDTSHARRPAGTKWGLYTTATTDVRGKPMRDTAVYHRDVYLCKVA
jgi:hypothetical protein